MVGRKCNTCHIPNLPEADFPLKSRDPDAVEAEERSKTCIRCTEKKRANRKATNLNRKEAAAAAKRIPLAAFLTKLSSGTVDHLTMEEDVLDRMKRYADLLSKEVWREIGYRFKYGDLCSRC